METGHGRESSSRRGSGSTSSRGICVAPEYVAETLLRAGGFSDVQYLELPEGARGLYDRVGSGAVDVTRWYLAPFIVAADKKAPIVLLSGVHVGCQEVVASSRIRTIKELKGTTVAAPFGGLSIVIAVLGHVGLDYRKDVIESTPQKIIAENTDWRFPRELRKELKSWERARVTGVA